MRAASGPKILRRIESGDGRRSDVELLMDICDNIAPGVAGRRRADDDLCPRTVDAVVDRVGDAELFPDEFADHVEHGGCPFSRVDTTVGA